MDIRINIDTDTRKIFIQQLRYVEASIRNLPAPRTYLLPVTNKTRWNQETWAFKSTLEAPGSPFSLLIFLPIPHILSWSFKKYKSLYFKTLLFFHHFVLSDYAFTIISNTAFLLNNYKFIYSCILLLFFPLLYTLSSYESQVLNINCTIKKYHYRICMVIYMGTLNYIKQIGVA